MNPKQLPPQILTDIRTALAVFSAEIPSNLLWLEAAAELLEAAAAQVRSALAGAAAAHPFLPARQLAETVAATQTR